MLWSLVIRKLFSKNSFLGLRSFILVGLACLLLFFDHSYRFCIPIRSWLSFSVFPIRHSVNYSVEAISHLKKRFTNKQILIQENEAFQANQLVLQAQIQQLNFLQQENAQLLALLNASKKLPTRFLTAKLLAIGGSEFSQQAILDRGTRDGIFVGQPVLDAYGVMGQVVLVDSIYSKVLLLSDKESAIPAVNLRNGLQLIVMGAGNSEQLKLDSVSMTADIKVGDLLVSSDLGQRFPEGYPIGVVTSVVRDPSKSFAQVSITPSAHLKNSRYVLITWPSLADISQLLKLEKQQQQQKNTQPKANSKALAKAKRKLKSSSKTNSGKSK